MIKIAASILSADFSCLGEEIKKTMSSNSAAQRADMIHLDVMDGHFVPNLTFGPVMVQALRRVCDAPFDVHLMIEPVSCFIDAFVAAGSDYITIHVEASRHIHRDLQSIRDCGKKVGIALNPATAIDLLTDVLDKIDMIVLMSVNPGFGGQSFIPSSLTKLERLRDMIGARKIDISVDGGVTPENAPALIKAGADILVAGSSIYKNPDYGKAIAALREKKMSKNR